MATLSQNPAASSVLFSRIHAVHPFSNLEAVIRRPWGGLGVHVVVEVCFNQGSPVGGLEPKSSTTTYTPALYLPLSAQNRRQPYSHTTLYLTSLCPLTPRVPFHEYLLFLFFIHNPGGFYFILLLLFLCTSS